MGVDPTIRFLRGPTGHQVAYAQHGEGPPLVFSAWWVSHVEEDWNQDGFRHFFERLGRHFTVFRYDRPGTGLSDRERERVDPADEVATLAAVIDHLDADRLSLFGLTCACPPALEFAVRNPERVEKLILFGSYVRGVEVAPANVREAIGQIVQAHWGMGAKLLTDLFDPELDAEGRKAMSRVQRKSASNAMAAELLQLTFETDVTDVAGHVQAPALVLHRKDDRTIPFAAGRQMAAALPNASFQPLDGSAHVPWAGDVDAAVDAILRFLGAEETTAPAATSGPRYGLVRAGDVWALTFDGEAVHLKNARGLADLAVLLAHPNQDVPADVLWTGGEADGPLALAEDPMLDDEALAAYRSRLREVEAELAEAGGARVDELRDERDAIARELRGALGLGGRRRELDVSSERARKAVTARIRASLEKISQALPAAGVHLNSSVQTGTFCSYQALDGIAWEVR